MIQVIYSGDFIRISCIANARDRVNANVTHKGGILFDDPMYQIHNILEAFNIYEYSIDKSKLGDVPEYLDVVIFYDDIGTRQQVVLYKRIMTDADPKLRSLYLGNKELALSYCVAVPDPNPRNLYIGCEDFVVERIHEACEDLDTDGDGDRGDSIIAENTIYYWYTPDGKLYRAAPESGDER